MEDLTSPTSAQIIAAEINASLKELVNHNIFILTEIHKRISTSGQQAAIMQQFTTKGVKTLNIYDTLHEAVTIADPNHTAPVINKSTFKVKNDGTVDYEEPPAPAPNSAPVVAPAPLVPDAKPPNK